MASSSSTSFTYDVFLTFFGVDTRYGFAGNFLATKESTPS